MTDDLSGYVMGYTDLERTRLSMQGEMLAPYTRQLLRDAGLAYGMRVLDIGCGVGEVAFLAAELVGRAGHVTAIDVDQGALHLGRLRADSLGIRNVTFLRGDACSFSGSAPFDAVIGRHVLVHIKEPFRAIQQMYEVLRSGGVVALHEFHLSGSLRSFPQAPLFDESFALGRQFFLQSTNGDIGAHLYYLLQRAGFTTPNCRAETHLHGGPNSTMYEWYAQTMRSILPRMEAAGLTTATALRVNTLAQRLREEAIATGAALPFPLMVAAFARKP